MNTDWIATPSMSNLALLLSCDQDPEVLIAALPALNTSTPFSKPRTKSPAAPQARGVCMVGKADVLASKGNKR